MVKRSVRPTSDQGTSVTTMLSGEEVALLHGLARQFQGRGAIVDAGCFLGGSTVALASGLRASKRARAGIIHSYDLLRADPWQMAGYSQVVDKLEPGTSVRHLFEQNVKPYRKLITLHEGDILEAHWPGEPVEILFVDICKSWDLNAHIVREFFGSLIPGQSIMVQQDLVHWGHPWCAIVMETLGHRFEYLGWTWYSSSVWKCKSRPTEEELSIDWRDGIGLERGLELLRSAAQRHGGWAEVELELARASLLFQFGEAERALAEVDRVEGVWGTSVPDIENGYSAIRIQAMDMLA
ncbi:MAG: hypothetical protein J2P57_07845 [Acidimicrobiaceae bacterium]|nr:hypothetical protein [Acidimicrobiaceae bacterium]